MCHLLNPVITLAALDVMIKELHRFLLGSLWFIAWAKGTKQEAGESWSMGLILAFHHPGELQRGAVLPSIPEPFCLAQGLFSLGWDTASSLPRAGEPLIHTFTPFNRA